MAVHDDDDDDEFNALLLITSALPSNNRMGANMSNLIPPSPTSDTTNTTNRSNILARKSWINYVVAISATAGFICLYYSYHNEKNTKKIVTNRRITMNNSINSIRNSLNNSNNSTSLAINTLCTNAQLAAAEGNYLEAIKFYSSAISIDPRNSELYANRSHLYNLINKPLLALYDAKSSLQIQPNHNPAALIAQARAAQLAADIPTAIKLFNKAVKQSVKMPQLNAAARELLADALNQARRNNSLTSSSDEQRSNPSTYSSNSNESDQYSSNSVE
jgi:tetratricopeptide (TPR) repeat protein